MSAWIGEGLGAGGGVHMMRRDMKTSMSDTISYYRPHLPEYDAITWLGIGLAIFANMLIAVSLNIQKFAHNKNEALGAARQPYHKIPLWWAGMVVNAVGEVGNLVAYGYAEATVVTPIGAVGVIFSAVIATFVLKEKFLRTHFIGILLIAAGVVLIVYSKGNEKVIEPTVEEAIHQYFLTTQSVIYLIVISVSGIFLKGTCEKYGDQYVILYVSLCSLIAAWTVLGSKAFMAFFRLTVEKGQDQLGRFPAAFFAWGMLLVVIVAAVASLHFLQMAMMHHENNKVIPTYYATFTLSCIIGAAIVYREFEGLSAGKMLLFFLGLCLSGSGVFVLSMKEEETVEMRGEEGDLGDTKIVGKSTVRWGRNGEGLRLVEMDVLAQNANNQDLDQSYTSYNENDKLTGNGAETPGGLGAEQSRSPLTNRDHESILVEAPDGTLTPKAADNGANGLGMREHGIKGHDAA